MGSIYVEVTGNVANNGIMLMEASGTTPSQGGYWLHWETNGFTAKSWLDLSSYIDQTGWPSVAESHGYAADWEGFLLYMETNPSNLDDVLGNWSNKGDFVSAHLEDLGLRTDENPTGCVEFA